ncbi:MAG: aminotransferase class I/II-fold pyridoxal phosphate-dependent enzyme [Euryarchaeota archaeon]|nr:aminotransferase class I/II-fold pyridoxal phosphate-dependent enzyme [Euryarchaeota archaeon]
MRVSCRFPTFALDEWLDAHESRAKYEIATSAIPGVTFESLGIDLSKLGLGYSEATGSPELYRELALSEKVDSERIAITTAGTEANFLGLLSLIDPGERVLVETPTYEQLAAVPAFAGADVERVHRREDLDWGFDVDEVRSGFERGAKLFVLANPNNPTGRALDVLEMKRLAEVAAEHEGVLFVDEIFRELALKQVPPAHSIADNIVTTNAFSKCFGRGGLRIGWLVGPIELAAEVRRVRGYTSGTPPVVSQALGIQALKSKPRLLERARRIRDTNLGIMRRFVEDSSLVSWREPSGGIIGAIRLPKSVDDEKFARRLLEEHSTLVVPGGFFGLPGFVRVGYGGDATVLAKGLSEFSTALRASL